MTEKINIISTGSIGNAVVINENIMIDCGVAFVKLKEVYKKLQLVLLTHIHCDHFNKSTIKKISEERPTLRFVCGDWLVNDLIKCGVNPKNIDILTPKKKYKFKSDLFIKLEETYHNVPNCCYKIEDKNKKIFYATDTYSLDGIVAPNYDLYLVEANYEEEEMLQRIERKKELNQFVYENNAMYNHMSKERIDNWLINQARNDSEIIYLHQHKEREKYASNK